jgi:hypothetical protein
VLSEPLRYGWQSYCLNLIGFKPVPEIAIKADFTYSITPDNISITDTTKGSAVGNKRHLGCLAQDRVLASRIYRHLQNHVGIGSTNSREFTGSELNKSAISSTVKGFVPKELLDTGRRQQSQCRRDDQSAKQRDYDRTRSLECRNRVSEAKITYLGNDEKWVERPSLFHYFCYDLG